MKKTLKTFTALLLLFAFLGGRMPARPSFNANTNANSGIALCGDDEAPIEAITKY